MKKLTWALAAAGLVVSLGAAAAVPTGEQPFDVSVPNIQSGINFLVEGLYQQPSETGLDYLTYSTSTNGNNDNYVTKTFNPKYDFGFKVGVGYVFPNSGNDLQLSWTHFNSNRTETTVTPSNSNISTPGFNGFDGAVDVSAYNKFKYDAFDLSAGQFLDLGTHLTMRLSAGLRYAEIKQENKVTASGTSDQSKNANQYSEVVSNAKFNGIGPDLGLRAVYHVANDIGVIGSVNVGVLAGKAKLNAWGKTTVTSKADGSILDEYNNSAQFDNRNTLVPYVDTKLGADWTVPFNDTTYLSVEGGWQMTHYFKVLDSTNSFSYDSSRQTNDFGLSGPYVSLNLKI